MSKAAKNRASKNRIKKRGARNTSRNKERKRLRALGWPSKGGGSSYELTEEDLKAKVLASIDEEMEAATSLKALKNIAKEAQVSNLKSYKAADREKLKQAVRDAVLHAWEAKQMEDTTEDPEPEPIEHRGARR